MNGRAENQARFDRLDASALAVFLSAESAPVLDARPAVLTASKRDEWDRMIAQDEKARLHADWKRRCAEAAAHERKGPPKPFPREADEWDDSDAIEHPRNRHADTDNLAAVGADQEPAYLAHCLNMSGRTITAEQKAKSVERQQLKLNQTLDLAAALTDSGVRCLFNGDKGRPRAYLIDPITEQAIELPDVRRVNFFPTIAAQRRAPLLKEVEAWLLANPHDRMATFTRGQRVPLHHLRRYHIAFGRRLSKLNGEKWFQDLGLSIVMRAIEYGTPKFCDRVTELEQAVAGKKAHGFWTLHLHAHAIFHQSFYLEPAEWEWMLKRVQKFMGARWEPGRIIKRVRECVKYPVKGCDLQEMLNLGGAEAIREFYQQTFKLRPVSLMRGLKWQKARGRRDVQKRLWEHGPDGRFMNKRRDWNARRKSGAKTAAEKAREKKKREYREQAGPAVKHPGAKPPPMVNRIVARLAPAPYFDRVYTPAVLVWNFDGNYAALRDHRCMKPVLDAVRPQIEEARASLDQGSHQSRNCPELLPDRPNRPPKTYFERVDALLSR